MHFFNIDLHISVIADMKQIFTNLGHNVTDKSLSDHTWVFNRKKDSIPMLDNDRWLFLSPADMSDKFYKLYREELNEYDAFIVTYPPTFSLLYKYFDKPIIINSPIRYEWPFSFNKTYWEQFNTFLRKGYDDKKIILIANNLYDKYYMELFIKRPVIHIPSICDYIDSEYIGSNNKFLYYSKDKIFAINNSQICYKNDILKEYQYNDLLKFKGIIHFPYQVSYMSIFEQYNLNIPLILPTQKFLLNIYKDKKYSVLQEMSWNRYLNQESYSYISCDATLDPNNYNSLESIEHWIQYADYYNSDWMPYITYFDSFEELNSIVNTLNCLEISNKMKNFNKTRKQKIYQLWSSILSNLQK